MPRVKVDYVVSVSSEDPDNQANNLLAAEVSKKKWLCAKGEQSCSVVLQLTHAVTISAVHIGAHHAAFVEVLVGTSERANGDYEVLVPRCVFCGPSESRKDEPVQRVRSFGGEQLTEARGRRWDRVRVMCSQPYNKHCQFGLSFVHIFEPEDAPEAPVEAKPGHPVITALNKGKFSSLGSYSSDEEEFRPGELFAKHRQGVKDNSGNHISNTGAQIRQATSQALKNISDADTKLKKTPLAKRKRDSCDPGTSQAHDRSRDSLMYTPDEDQPHAKIDRVVIKHKEERKKTDESQNIKNTNVKKGKDESSNKIQKKKDDSFNRSKEKTSKNIDQSPSTSKTLQNRNNESETRKRPRSDDGDSKGTVDPTVALRGVVFALSGFVQPQRGRLRDAALTMGARYRPDWAPDCTHLVCAFPNTPKMRQVVSSAPHAYVVSASWLWESAKEGRRLPERCYHMGPNRPKTPPPTPKAPPLDDQEEDTDEEIEKVVRQQKKKWRADPSPAPSADDEPTNVDENEGEATEQEGEASSDEGSISPLPAFLDGKTIVVDDDVEGVGFDPKVLSRYAKAYGALVLPEGSEADIRLGAGPQSTRPDWLWKCHHAKTLLDTSP